jgi:class 3 adenylate cyclase/tetratricopeptide (TPR) repeat protein
MRCPSCQADNPSENRFCDECGAPLEARCPQCGASLRPGKRFCGGCGRRVTAAEPGPAPASPAPGPSASRTRPASYTPAHLADKILKGRSALEGERRQVTVLFADVAGFTALAEQLDPEDVHEIIDRCFELITAEVHRFEGTINQYTGDGVMALFGAPLAHEDSPRRAAHAALGIQRSLRELSRELQARRGFGVQMRIGINTGLVVVGRIGDDLRMDYTAVGDTTNLAARLQSIARPGSVLVSEATHKLLAGFFETLDLGPVEVKGHAPVRAFEVLRSRGRRAGLEASVDRNLTPLVGRGRELGALRELFAKVQAGHGQVVLVAGEAGIGKSRLLLEFRRTLARAGEAVTWLEGRCVSFGQSMPLLPLIDQLRENFGIEELDGEPEIIAKVEHGMRRLGNLEAHIPYIRYLLSVEPGDPAIAAMDAAARRKRIFDAGRALALRGAGVRPIVFVFEDLHWVDTSTEQYLGTLLDSVASVPVMLVLTFRLGYTPPFGARSFQTTLTLDSLSEAETMAMAGQVLGTEEFPHELRAAVMDKAEGVPLFVEEVTKTLLDLGVLRREKGGYRMVKTVAEVNVPDTIQGIIMARLDRLGEEGKRTVQLASVIGRQFLRRLLERIAGLTGELEGLLAELKALEIIYEQGLLQEPAYVFKHAVIQDVAYQSLLVQRRRQLHRAVAQAIEELYPDRLAEHYEELAHHFAQAEDWAKVLEYSVLAGDRAAHAFANVEARRHYVRAIEAADHVTPALAAGARASLLAKHATVLTVLAEYRTAAAEYQRSLALVRDAGDRQAEIETLVNLSTMYMQSHEPEPAIGHIDAALDIARALDDRATQAFCHTQRALVRSAGMGPIAETGPDVEAGLATYREIRQPRRLAQTLTWLGSILQWRGELDRGIALLREGADLAQREGAGFNFGVATFFGGHAHVSKGEYEEALRWYRRLSEYAEAAGDKVFLSRAPNSVGGVHLELFDADEAIRFCLEGDEISRTLWPWPEPRGHSLLKVGLAHLQKGEHGPADEFFRRASALLEADVWLRWRWHIPLLHARGELALSEGRPDEAWDWATQSLERATQTASIKHVARAERLRGEILAASGRLEEAARELRSSVALAVGLGTPREVWLAEASLGEVLQRLGRDDDAASSFNRAARTIEDIAGRLTTPGLRHSFLRAAPVGEVFRVLGRQPPPSDAG